MAENQPRKAGEYERPATRSSSAVALTIQTPPQPPLRQLGLTMTGFSRVKSCPFDGRSIAQHALVYYIMECFALPEGKSCPEKRRMTRGL
jgi:hypothetical protein